MTDKVTLTALANLQNETTAVNAINANSVAITTAMDNTLSRDGTAPNQMGATLDMNSNQIINLPSPATATSALRLLDLQSFVGGGTVSNIPTGGADGAVLKKTSTTDFATGWSSGATSDFEVLPSSDPVNAALRIQHGKGSSNYIDITNLNSNAINSQFLFKNTNSTYVVGSGLSVESRSQAGTNTAALGANFLAVSEGTTVQSGALGGANGFISIGKSVVGGDVFGGNTYAWAQTTVPRTVIGLESDIDNRISGNTSETALQLVKVATSTGVVSGGSSQSSAMIITNQAGASTWRDSAIQIGVASGIGFPLGSGSNILKVYAGTINTGFDLSSVTFSTGQWVVTRNNQSVTSYNAAGLSIKNLLKLDVSDKLSMYDGVFTLASNGSLSILGTGFNQFRIWGGTGTGGGGVLSVGQSGLEHSFGIEKAILGGSNTNFLIYADSASSAIDLYTANTLRMSVASTGGVSITKPLTLGGVGDLASVVFSGSTSGSTTVQPTVTASGTLILPAATDTLVGKATTDILTNKTYDSAGTGNVFKINGTTVTTATSLLDIIGSTQGQLLYRGASAWTALSPGTSGQFLQTLGAGANPAWATGSGAVTTGNRVLLATLTASSSASLADTTSLTSTYERYEIVFEAILPATNAVDMRLRVNVAGVQATTYVYALSGNSVSGGLNAGSAAGTFIPCTDTASVMSNTGQGLFGNFYVSNPSGTAAPKTFLGQMAFPASTGTFRTISIGGYWNGGNGAVTGIELTSSSGNIASGTIKIYGIVN